MFQNYRYYFDKTEVLYVVMQSFAQSLCLSCNLRMNVFLTRSNYGGSVTGYRSLSFATHPPQTNTDPLSSNCLKVFSSTSFPISLTGREKDSTLFNQLTLKSR